MTFKILREYHTNKMHFWLNFMFQLSNSLIIKVRLFPESVFAGDNMSYNAQSICIVEIVSLK